MSKDSLLFYKEWLPLINSLSADKRLLFYDLLMAHSGEDYAPEIADAHLKGVFDFVIKKVKENDRKYAEKCEKARESVSKRWNNNTNVSDGITTPTFEQKVIHNENDKVNDNVNEKENKKVDKAKIPFGDFWVLYDYDSGNKKTLTKQWDNLTIEQQQSIMAFIPKYLINKPDK